MTRKTGTRWQPHAAHRSWDVRVTHLLWATMAASLILLCAVAPVEKACAGDDSVHELNIAGQRLDGALNALAQQADVQLLFPFDVVSRFAAKPLVGRYTVAEALALLLADKPLASRLTSGGIIAISPTETATKLSRGEKMSSESSIKAGALAKIGAVLSAIFLTPPATAQQSAQTTQKMELEEVVVTALRRGDQKLLDTPIAVSAFGGDWVESRGYRGLEEFMQLAPGATINTFQPGVNRIQMRGISAGVGENNVGFYLDEVPMAFINQTNVPDVRAFDLERVEVLRGPQSTLYGAGALAGVVRSISKNPVLDAYEFKADLAGSATADGGENNEANVAFNAPLIDQRLGARLVYTREDQEGWIDERVLGKDDYNETQLENVRVKLLGRITDQLSASIMYWGSRVESNGTPNSFADRSNDDSSLTPSSFDYDIYNLTIRYQAANFDVLSSTSHAAQDTQWRADFLFGFPIESLLNPRTLTQEVRVVSTHGGPWQWTAGAYYRDADQTQIQRSEAMSLLGIDPVIQYDEVEAWNIFGELTGTFFDGRLETTFGGRYLEETRSSEQRFRPSAPYENDFDDVILRFNATYRPGADWMTYFNYGEGFRSGINQFAVSLETAAALGVILPSAAKPEYADSYELGLKGAFFDSRLTVDVALFYIKWKDLQTLVPIVAQALSGVVNAAEAESPGVELALNWLATERLQLGLVASWNDAQISQDVFANAAVLDPVTGLPTGATVPLMVFADGDRLNNVPEWTLGATADYLYPLANGMKLAIRGSAQYATEQELHSFGTATVGDSVLTVDGRVGVEAGRWGVHVFAKNLLDEDGLIVPDEVVPNYGVRYRPRTIGLNVTFQY